MERPDEWRDDLADRLRRFAKELDGEGHDATAASLRMLEGAVCEGKEFQIARWMWWFVRWRLLCLWLEERLTISKE